MDPTKEPERESFRYWIRVPDQWADYSNSIKLGHVITQLNKPHRPVHSVPEGELDEKPGTVVAKDLKPKTTKANDYKVGFWMHLVETIKFGVNVGRKKEASASESHEFKDMSMKCFIPSVTFLDKLVLVDKVKTHLSNTRIPEDEPYVFLITGLATGTGDKVAISGKEKAHNEAGVNVSMKGVGSFGPHAENNSDQNQSLSYTIEQPHLKAFRALKVGRDKAGNVTETDVGGNLFADEEKTYDTVPDSVVLPFDAADFQNGVPVPVAALDADGEECILFGGVLPEKPDE